MDYDELHYACYKGDFKKVVNLMEKEALLLDGHSIGDALRWSCFHGHPEIVKYLAEEKGADIHAENGCTLIGAASGGSFEIVKYLVEKGVDIHAENNLALRWASIYGHLEIVKYLAEKGANIHTENEEVLKNASDYGYFEIVKYLVEKGANKNVIRNEKILKYLNFINRIKIKKAIIIQRCWRLFKIKYLN